MSVSTHVVGIMEPDDEFRKMLAVYKSCDEAGVDPPRKVEEYFEDCDYEILQSGDITGREVSLCGLLDGDIEYTGGVTLDLSKLPVGVKKLRIYMSW